MGTSDITFGGLLSLEHNFRTAKETDWLSAPQASKSAAAAMLSGVALLCAGKRSWWDRCRSSSGSGGRCSGLQEDPQSSHCLFSHTSPSRVGESWRPGAALRCAAAPAPGCALLPPRLSSSPGLFSALPHITKPVYFSAVGLLLCFFFPPPPPFILWENMLFP